MSDEADLSSECMEREEEIKKKYRKPPGRVVEPTGFCLNCGEPLAPDVRWCDRDCQADWEKRANK